MSVRQRGAVEALKSDFYVLGKAIDGSAYCGRCAAQVVDLAVRYSSPKRGRSGLKEKWADLIPRLGKESHAELGREFNISREYVRQLHEMFKDDFDGDD